MSDDIYFIMVRKKSIKEINVILGAILASHGNYTSANVINFLGISFLYYNIFHTLDQLLLLFLFKIKKYYYFSTIEIQAGAMNLKIVVIWS